MDLIRIFLGAFVAALLVLVVPARSQAQYYDHVPWHTGHVSFVSQQRSVRDLLTDFAASQNLPLFLSDTVRGVTSGSFKDVETEKFLDLVCEANNFVWFYDGARMYIESKDEVVSRPLTVPYVSPEALNDALMSIGYASGPPGSEVQVRAGHRKGIVLLVGGPQFIRTTETLARDLDGQESKRVNEEMAVRSFRLNYAYASDISINSGGSTRVVPGIVSSLQALMANQFSGNDISNGPRDTVHPLTMPGLRGSGLAAVGNPNAGVPVQPFNPYDPTGVQQAQLQQQQAQSRPAAGPSQAAQNNGPQGPMIVADTRLNAVIVRDVAARMPLYENLIKMLDVPTMSIEITAVIVDIDRDNLREIGLELLGAGTKDGNVIRGGLNADRGQFDGVDTQGDIPSFFDGANLARGAGLNATALLSSGAYELLARLRLKEQVGAAHVITSPSVLTTENMQAVIRTDESIYVRVEGNLQADLFNVTTGVELRVTPSIVKQGGAHNFRLQIDITDGDFTQERVDRIPGTRESAINTQAMVPDNKTLLLGGYAVHRKSRGATQVPYIAKVPILGKLFAVNQQSNERRLRFFFITPRIVDLRQEATDPAAYEALPDDYAALPKDLDENYSSYEDSESVARRLAADVQGEVPQPPPRPTPLPTPTPTRVLRALPVTSEDKAVMPAVGGPAPASSSGTPKR